MAARTQLFLLLRKTTSCMYLRSRNMSLLNRSATLHNYSKSRLLLPNTFAINQNRTYVIGDYDKLWQAVSSGRGKGRGGKKKVTPKKVDGEFLKFGKSDVAWSTSTTELKRSTQFRRKATAHARGWCGKTWPGKHAGPPMSRTGDPVEEFDSIVIEVKKVSSTRASGRKKRTSALVVVGNKKGLIGWAIGKASFATPAIRKAKNKAVNYLHHVPICEGDTIYHDLRTKVKSTTIQFERKVPGYGRRCQRIIRAITELAGIENIRCKIAGRTTPLTVVRACFQGLQMQETHDDLAERTGKLVVEFRNEKNMQPVVVGQPSKEAMLRRQRQEDARTEEDITEYFYPNLGAHRAKSVHQIQGAY